MSVSKFFRNFLTLPLMKSKESNCHQNQETEYKKYDVKMQQTQDVEFQFSGSDDYNSDQRQNVSEDVPATDLNEDLHLNLRVIDTATLRDTDRNVDDAEENKTELVVTITSNGPSSLSWTEEETKNDSTAEYGQSTLTTTQIHTNGVCPVEFTSLQAMAIQTKDDKTEEETNIIDKLFQDIVNERNFAAKTNDFEVADSDDECISIASSLNTVIYEEAVCQGMELEIEDTEEAVIKSDVTDFAASADVHRYFLRRMKSNQTHSNAAKSILASNSRQSDNDLGASSTFRRHLESTQSAKWPSGSTLLSNGGVFQSEAVNAASYSYQSHHDLGASSSFRRHLESTQSAKLPPGSTLHSNRGVFRIKDKEKPFACGYCGKAYRKKLAVYEHVRSQHDEKRCSCEFCGKRFAKPSHLAIHIAIHTQEKLFACEQCGKKFRFNSSLCRHKFTHSTLHCNRCEKSFKSRRHFAIHKESHMKEEENKGLTCDICQRKFGKPYLLKEHMMIHSGEKPFKCTLCEKQFRLKAYLRDHMNIHQDSGKLADKPESVSGNIDFVSQISTDMRFHSGENPHMMINFGETPLESSLLEEQIQLKTRLLNHPIYSHDGHISRITNSGKFCNEDVSECEVVIRGESQIQNTTRTEFTQSHTKDHSSKTMIGNRVSVATGVIYDDDRSQLSAMPKKLLSSDYSDSAKTVPSSYSRQAGNDNGMSPTFWSRFESIVSSKLPPGSTLLSRKGVFRIKDKKKPFACGYCGNSYKVKRAVYSHIIDHHEEKRYSCEFCGKRFAQQCHLLKHAQMHMLEKPFTCGECGKQFRFDAGLRRHKYTHSEERLFSCNECNKSFKIRDTLLRHKESHKTEEQKKGVACDICNRKFSKPSLLKQHTRIHTGEKPFKCTLCEKQFRTKLVLLQHMDSHNGKKRLAKEPCSICSKSFWATHMPNHMRMHAGVKPFECNICGKRFPKKQTLEGHIRSHTGEKPFACDRCDKRFTLYNSMATHKAKCKALTDTLA